MATHSQHIVDLDGNDDSTTADGYVNIKQPTHYESLDNGVDAVLQQYYAACWQQYEDLEVDLVAESDMAILGCWWPALGLENNWDCSTDAVWYAEDGQDSMDATALQQVNESAMIDINEFVSNPTIPILGEREPRAGNRRLDVGNQPEPLSTSPSARATFANVCSVPSCGKSFKYPKDLRRHLFTHTRERPHCCPKPECEYYTQGFSRYDALKRHLDKVHAPKGE